MTNVTGGSHAPPPVAALRCTHESRSSSSAGQGIRRTSPLSHNTVQLFSLIRSPELDTTIRTILDTLWRRVSLHLKVAVGLFQRAQTRICERRASLSR